MIDTKELRRLVEEDGKRNIDLGEIHELLDSLEAAEKERDALRTKIEEMEQQKPVGWFARIDGDGPLMECKHADISRVPLYLAPGAQPAPSVPDIWPVYADPFAYVIQHLNSNPYSLTKDETITFIKELRALYNAGPESKA